MDLYLKVRRAHFQDGLSGRRIAGDFGISRDSVAKMLACSEPPGYRRTAPIGRPKLDESSGAGQIFPNEPSIMRLIGAVLFEQNDEWQTTSRSMQVEAFAQIDHEVTDPMLSIKAA